MHDGAGDDGDAPVVHGRLGWPSNWRQLMAQLTKYYGWSPSMAMDLTGSELVWWCRRANEMIEEEGKSNG